ncbi:hypothetical protein QEH68_11935 [Paenarthrobacter sp. OM7]|uniref:hypothetical protein n=1 Tax=Paenarthrobacter sp. OM7 TaxID=3041264 RepID=UPI0024695E69|nr:hypothetical protein [Paenarthrobacter sp. OM7]WGM18768.1 hypothetical protein QEH68_11935 [Paenarthrobacter sp. OM7]
MISVKSFTVMLSKSAPLMLVLAADVFGIAVLTAILGNSNHAALAAFNLIAVFFITGSAAIAGVVRGIALEVAPFKEDHASARLLISDGRWLSLVVGATASCCMLALPALSTGINVDQAVINELGFMPVVSAAGLLLQGLAGGGQASLLALDRSQDVAWSGIADTLIVLSLGPLLILGLGPVPAMGPTGAVAALVGASLASMIVANWRLVKVVGKTGMRKPRWGYVVEMAKLGLPISANALMKLGAFAVVAATVSTIGVVPAAAYAIVLSLSSFITLPATAVGQFAGPDLARQAKSENYRTFRTNSRQAQILMVVLTVLASLLMIATPISGVYTSDTSVQDTLRGSLVVFAVAALFEGLRVMPNYELTLMKRKALTTLIFGIGYGLLTAYMVSPMPKSLMSVGVAVLVVNLGVYVAQFYAAAHAVKQLTKVSAPLR